MGGKISDTPAMKRDRLLEEEVRKTVSTKLGKKIKKCGLFLSKQYPVIAGSPNGICGDSIIEIKCPMSAKTYKTYILNGKPAPKYYGQMQLQMSLAGLHIGHFCVADWNYSINKKVEVISVTFDDKYVLEFMEVLVSLWKDNVYPLLCQSVM